MPLLDGTRRRLGNIPDATWHDPYVVGFLGMLITMIATRAAGPLGQDDLAAVQSKAWADITGESGDLLGEEICFYDAAFDNRFTSGCRNAESFFQALHIATRQGAQRLGAEPDTPLMTAEGDVRSTLWSRYFDAHLGEAPASAMP